MYNGIIIGFFEIKVKCCNKKIRNWMHFCGVDIYDTMG